jgi:hypothetical protein
MNLNLEGNICNRFVGILQIHELHKNGNLIIKNAPNVITYDARTIMSYLLAGEQSASKSIATLRVGTNATAETRNDTALGTQVDSVAVTYTFPNVDRVQFEAILPNTTPANGFALVEAGLFNTDSQMFSRQTYSVITKTSAIQLKYIWTIIFT